MIAFISIIYIAAVVLVFKVFKVKPGPWSIALMATIGFVLLGGIIILWTIAAPISPKAVVGRYVVELVPYVKGQVVSIPAQPNVPLKKGDILFQIDPKPYQYAVDQVQAQLQAAKSNVKQMSATVRVAEANVKKAEANVTASKAALDVAVAIQKENPQAISKLKMVQAEESYAAAQATLQVSQASEEQARSGLAAANDTVINVESQLQLAEFNLAECTVRAPADGFVTNWGIRVGTFVVPMPMAAIGSFVDTSDTYIAAPFPAQMLIHVKPDQPVEMAFKSRPGRLFRGTVANVIQATGEGQIMTGGKLPSATSIGSPGYLAVKIRLDEDEPAELLEMGSAGIVAIYTDWGKPFAMISKVTVRMKKWIYFLPIPS